MQDSCALFLDINTAKVNAHSINKFALPVLRAPSSQRLKYILTVLMRLLELS